MFQSGLPEDRWQGYQRNVHDQVVEDETAYDEKLVF